MAIHCHLIVHYGVQIQILKDTNVLILKQENRRKLELIVYQLENV